MTLSSVLFLFLTHLAVGIALTLSLVSRDAGVKFFRFIAGLAAAVMAAAFAFQRGALPQSGAPLVAFAALGVSGLALVIYWATVGRVVARARGVLSGAAIAAGLIGVVAEAVALAGSGLVANSLIIASFLTSAALLGGACGALILGHWYLIVPSMDVAHLQSLVKFHIISMIARTAVVMAAVLMALLTWEPGAGPSFKHYILSSAGIFFWQRVLFGLIGPAVLSYLTWETAKIRSTQSATGILYVDFFTVIVGEVLAKYLLLATAVPV